ncbi:TM2 domain-containing protein [Euhalothece natronophila]|nr:TM2 domain-containing protein [Euhalothece natronophila]
MKTSDESQMSNYIVYQRNKPTAYALWCFCLFSVCGIHRFYARRYLSGVIYLLTWGFFGLGQFMDLFLIPNMVDEENLKMKALYGYQPNQASFYQTPESIVVNLPRSQPPEVNSEVTEKQYFTERQQEPDLDRAILRTVKDAQGATLAEIFLEVRGEYEEIEERVEYLMSKNLLIVDNRPDDGAVIYKLN